MLRRFRKLDLSAPYLSPLLAVVDASRQRLLFKRWVNVTDFDGHENYEAGSWNLPGEQLSKRGSCGNLYFYKSWGRSSTSRSR